MYDILIKNAIVFDGSGTGNGLRLDVAVEGGKISAVKEQIGASAHVVIDGEGLYLAPGFIDIQNHSDSHGLMLSKPAMESLVSQGVTTAVVGQCGASMAPLPKPEAMKSLQKWGLIEGMNTDWQTFAEFADRFGDREFGVNIISFVGHGTLRRVFTGDESRELNPSEIKQLAAMLRQSLKEGAYGISFGFQYGHELKTSAQEVFALLSVIKEYDKIFSLHLKSQDVGFGESLAEIVEIAKTVEVKTKISHLKVEGKRNLPQLAPALRAIEQAYQSKTRIHFDVYPYTTTWRPLYTYLPGWAYEGGFKPMLERIKDKKLAPKILHELSESRAKLESLLVSSSPKVPGFLAKTVGEIAKRQAKTAEETVLAILSANKGQSIVFDNDVDPAEVTTLLKHPLSFVASDGIGYPMKPERDMDLPHPRCYGTFPRFLRMLREDEVKDNNIPLMSWSEGIAKISGRPAEFLGLKDRGLVKKGYKADLVLFNPKEISDSATYNNPFQAPKGMRYVINNGKISLFEGQLTGVNAGKLIIDR